MSVCCPRCGAGSTRHYPPTRVRGESIRSAFVCGNHECLVSWSEVEEVQRLRYLLPRLTHAMGSRCLNTVELGALLKLCRTQVELEARRG